MIRQHQNQFLSSRLLDTQFNIRSTNIVNHQSLENEKIKRDRAQKQYKDMHRSKLCQLVSPKKHKELEEAIRDEQNRRKIKYSEEVYREGQVNKIQRYQCNLIEEIKHQNQIRIDKGFLFIHNKIQTTNSNNNASNLLIQTNQAQKFMKYYPVHQISTKRKKCLNKLTKNFHQIRKKNYDQTVSPDFKCRKQMSDMPYQTKMNLVSVFTNLVKNNKKRAHTQNKIQNIHYYPKTLPTSNKNESGDYYKIENIHDNLNKTKNRQKISKLLIIQSIKPQFLQKISERFITQQQLQDQIFKINQKSFQQKIKRQKRSQSLQQHINIVSPKISQSIYPKNRGSIVNNCQIGVYQQKIIQYRQFIFIVNLAHKIFDPLNSINPLLLFKLQKNNIIKFKYFVGAGNNSRLIRQLMKRRWWWQQTFEEGKAHFIWTQLKMNNLFIQQPTNRCHRYNQDSLVQIDRYQKIQIFSRKIRKQMKISSLNFMTIQPFFKCNSIKSSKQLLISSKLYTPKGLMFKPPFAVADHLKILTLQLSNRYNQIINNIPDSEMNNFENRIKYFPKNRLHYISKDIKYTMHNHLQGNNSLGNKKSLYYHFKLYYQITHKPLYQAFPQTFHIRKENDQQFKQFIKAYNFIKENGIQQNIWILKPGQNSNRGSGIIVFKSIKHLQNILKSKYKQKKGQGTFIIQKYIEKPLLYHGRKFDLRHYLVVSCLYGQLRAYWYGEGYVRTSVQKFNLKELNDPIIHLTNDAIQKQSDDYGSYEDGNKISYNQLQKYFTNNHPQLQFDFSMIYIKMRELAKDAVSATYLSIDPSRRMHNFQLFGFDFMIDQKLNVMLIEVNKNPCLELCCGVLQRVIPLMLDQTFRMTLDVIFSPPAHYNLHSRHLTPDCSLNKFQFQLIFDETRDGQQVKELYKHNQDKYDSMIQLLEGINQQEDDIFDEQGDESTTGLEQFIN